MIWSEKFAGNRPAKFISRLQRHRILTLSWILLSAMRGGQPQQRDRAETEFSLQMTANKACKKDSHLLERNQMKSPSFPPLGELSLINDLNLNTWAINCRRSNIHTQILSTSYRSKPFWRLFSWLKIKTRTVSWTQRAYVLWWKVDDSQVKYPDYKVRGSWSRKKFGADSHRVWSLALIPRVDVCGK